MGLVHEGESILPELICGLNSTLYCVSYIVTIAGLLQFHLKAARSSEIIPSHNL